ncbi:hypothetical protein Aperf_G00000005562 [Anoplocephala perfoliata]
MLHMKALSTTPIPLRDEEFSDPDAFDSAQIDEVASMNDLDSYLDLLYEDIPEQIRASALILQLARNPNNLNEICQKEALIGALARVLREEWRKSIHLTTNLMYIFFCLSSFSNFHSLITHFKIGALCMTILEHELLLYADWMEEIRKVGSENNDDSSVYKATVKKIDNLIRKQEQLFRVSIYMLLHLAEKEELEEKMSRRGIVYILCQCLCRKNQNLLILVVSFLQKLSLYQENIEQMVENNIMEGLLDQLTAGQPELVRPILRLLYNLSFNQGLRASMMKLDLPRKLVSLINEPVHQETVLRILYQLSKEDKFKSLIAKSGCLPFLMRSFTNDSTKDLSSELECLSLLINLACDQTAARILGESEGIRILLKHAFATRSPLLMKLLRNLSQFEDLRIQFIDHLPDLASSITWLKKGNVISKGDVKLSEDSDIEVEDAEDLFSLECLGTLANLQLENFDFLRILEDLHLLPWIEDMLSGDKQDHRDDDILLETIRLISTICIDVEAAKVLVLGGSTVIPKLIDLLGVIEADEEMVFQIFCIFHRLLSYEETRNHIIKELQTSKRIFDSAKNENMVLREIQNDILNIISEHDAVWSEAVRSDRFKIYNSKWIQMISSASPERREPKLEEVSSDEVEKDEDHPDRCDLLLASSLLEDADGWITTSLSDHHVCGTASDSELKLNLLDVDSCCGDDDDDPDWWSAQIRDPEKFSNS